ncbi:hypothetical protein FRB95_003643 [Tulasnella sp. JGI-2019a]|nr:hypothetical protein FRB95_003643 [Tulasnella sp. JGI-2019a]
MAQGWFTYSRRYAFEGPIPATTPATTTTTGLSSAGAAPTSPITTSTADTPSAPPTGTGQNSSASPKDTAVPPKAPTPPSTASSTEIGNTDGPPSIATEFERFSFGLTMEKAIESGPYDIIIVGTGIGGGVLAHDLYETNSRIGDAAQNILVIEKGGLIFHSHCLNTSRSEGSGDNRGEQNETIFAHFKEDYKVELKDSTESGAPPATWKGGPMYCVGGRSAAWGLFAPRVHDGTLARWFPKKVEAELKNTYFEKAEALLNLSLPTSKIIHQHLLERLNISTDNTFAVNWQWARMASEFKNSGSAEGAYSTIDKLLEIMMSRPPASDDPAGNERAEHVNFKMLLRTEVRKVELDTATKTATGVIVRATGGGPEKTIKLKAGGRVVLATGSVASPAILLRSGVRLGKEAGHITDHDILYRSVSFRYLKPEYRDEVGPMKLQTFFLMGTRDRRFGLANMSIDASSYLPGAKSSEKNLHQMIISFMLPCALEPSCSITLEGDEPKVVITRSQEYNQEDRRHYLKRMEDVTKSAISTMEKYLKAEFVDEDRPGDYLSYLELGGAAHELGSLPMPGRGRNELHSIDEDLKLCDYQGIYVCDNSIFPMSPAANPTLTLAALSIRLSRALVARDRQRATNADTIWIVNHSSEAIKVWVTNYGNVTRPASELEAKTLRGGEDFSVTRRSGVNEAVMVFRLDRAASVKTPGSVSFSTKPELFLAHPGLLPVTVH